MPSEDAAWVGAELARRFGLPYWSFALTATDANRWAIRLARALTGRPKILVNNFCYHGSVDESLIMIGPDGAAVSRSGNVGPPVDVRVTSRVAEYNDLDGLKRELSHGDVAAVLMEPALTNIGIVLPQDGYLDGVRSLTRQYGTLLINDETHTFSAGPGGCTRAWNLHPDMLTIGKAIGGGIPTAAYGLSEDIAQRLTGRPDLDLIDVGGVGGTLAGNALSVAAMRATLEDVLTDDAFAAMIRLAVRVELPRPLMNPIGGGGDGDVQSGCVKPLGNREADAFRAAGARHNGDLSAHVYRRHSRSLTARSGCVTGLAWLRAPARPGTG